MTTAAEQGRRLDVEAIRREFPSLQQAFAGKRLVYLDSACTALKPRRVAERLSDFYLNWGGCGGKRSTHLASQQVETWMAEARAVVAGFAGAESPNEIVLTSGTTEAVNLVARAFPFRAERREVVLTDLEHNAVFLPFYEAARRGEITLKFARQKDGRVENAELERLISPQTALLCLTRASNVMGGVQPVAEACRLAHGRGAQVLCDYAQFYSSHRESLSEVNVDYAVFSGHKLGGPFGVGALYGKENRLNGLGHYKVGGGTVKSVSWPESGPQADYLDAPMRFEAGVGNFGSTLGFAEALTFLSGLPARELREHMAALVRRAALALTRFPQIRVLGEPERLAEGSLVSFYPVHKEFSVTDFNLFLNHELPGRAIAVRAGEHCAHLLHLSLKIPATVRLSFFAYNTEAEVDLFLEALEGYIQEACA